MNTNQKKILIAVITIIAGMLLYPPFQVVVSNGMVFNMGYDWITSPPKRGSIVAGVNVSMLLVQWVGVLVMGGLAILLAKTPPDVHPIKDILPENKTVLSHRTSNFDLNNLYEIILGEKNRKYYLTKFEHFDQHSDGSKTSWNWPAFFAGGIWALYRKMYGWFFVFLGIAVVSNIFEKAGSLGLSAAIFLVPWITFPMYANWLYYRNLNRKIASARLSTNEESKLTEHLRAKGGVHKWVIWVFGWGLGGLIFIGILMSVLIPMFNDRGDKSTSMSAPMEQNETKVEPNIELKTSQPNLPKDNPQHSQTNGLILEHKPITLTDGYAASDKIHMVGGNNGKKPYLGFILNTKTKVVDSLILAGQYDLALQIYLELDAKGDTTASHNAGLMYIRGMGTTKDIKRGMLLLEKSMTDQSNYATSEIYYQKAAKELSNSK